MSDLIRTNHAAIVFPNGRWEYADTAGLGGLYGLAEYVAKRLGGRLAIPAGWIGDSWPEWAAPLAADLAAV